MGAEPIPRPSADEAEVPAGLEDAMQWLGTNEEEESSSQDSHSSYGYRYTSPEEREETKFQRKATWEWLKKVGFKVFDGSSLTSISLPVKVFETRSFLERLTDNWAYVDYLQRAAAQTDPIERFKLVIAFVVSGLSKQTCQSKPFNPILGETYQASFDGGISIYCEQTSHHPPISEWKVQDSEGLFEYTGTGSWTAHIRANTAKGQQEGVNRVQFKADDGEITWDLPSIHLKNVMWGERTLLYTGEIHFEDKQNGLRCELVFDPDAKKGSYFARMFKGKTCPDLLRGDILKSGPQGSEKMEKVATVEGIWLSHLDVGIERIWDIRRAYSHKPTPVKEPLPTDCRFRQDLIALANKDYEGAQMWKEKLEQKQREEEARRKKVGCEFVGSQSKTTRRSSWKKNSTACTNRCKSARNLFHPIDVTEALGFTEHWYAAQKGSNSKENVKYC